MPNLKLRDYRPIWRTCRTAAVMAPQLIPPTTTTRAAWLGSSQIASGTDSGVVFGPQAHHLVVVLGVVAYVADPVLVLQPAQPGLQPRRPGNGPGPVQGERITSVGLEHFAVVGGLRETGVDGLQIGDLRDQPGFGAVGQVSIAEQHHRGTAGDRNPAGLDRGVEAVGR